YCTFLRLCRFSQLTITLVRICFTSINLLLVFFSSFVILASVFCSFRLLPNGKKSCSSPLSCGHFPEGESLNLSSMICGRISLMYSISSISCQGLSSNVLPLL